MNIICWCENYANPHSIFGAVGLGSWGQIRHRGGRFTQIAAFPSKRSFFIKTIVLKYDEFTIGFFILVDLSLTSNLKFKEYITMYVLRLISWEILESVFFCPNIIHVMVKIIGFKMGQQKISALVKAWPLHFH